MRYQNGIIYIPIEKEIGIKIGVKKMIILKKSKTEIQQQLKNAIAKCRNLEKKPKVKMIEPNRYEVIGNENQYRVTMRIGANGAKVIDCSC